MFIWNLSKDIHDVFRNLLIAASILLPIPAIKAGKFELEFPLIGAIKFGDGFATCLIILAAVLMAMNVWACLVRVFGLLSDDHLPNDIWGWIGAGMIGSIVLSAIFIGVITIVFAFTLVKPS